MTKNDFNFSVTFTVATCYIADDVSLVINRNKYINRSPAIEGMTMEGKVWGSRPA